jgi:hypothetical protein
LNFYYFFNKIDDAQFDQNMAMENMWRALHVLQQENNMYQAFEQLQVRARHAPHNFEDIGNQQVLQPILQPIRKPRISLLEKFDGHDLNF